jgi:NTE family protein
MRQAWRALAACAALALAGCITSDVPPQRLPRFMKTTGAAPRIALVLGSGGPRGFAHIGVIKVLEESGIKPDLIVGSSVGSMVGALYASGMSAAQLEKLAHEINILQFVEWSVFTHTPGTGKPIQEYVNERVHDKAIEELPIAFAAAATRMSDHKLVLFNRGDTGLAVRASSASAPDFNTVRIGDETYMDSDELSPVPIHSARTLGAKVVIAVDVSAFAADTPAGVPQEWIDKDARRAKQVAVEAPEADVLLHPNIGYYAGHSEEYRRRVIDAAERYTRQQLPAIRLALERAGVATPQAASARTPAGETSR